jgi:hypothetical protein
MFSQTDFKVYTKSNAVPGLDLAFYQPRTLYHTSKDDVNQTSPMSVQHVGDNVLGVVQQVANSAMLLPSNSAGVYYDILGISMISYSFTASIIVSAFLIVFVLGALVVHALLSYRQLRDGKVTARKITSEYAIALVAINLSFLFGIIVCAVVAEIFGAINPTATTGQPWLFLALTMGSTFLGNIVAQYLWLWLAKRAKRHLIFPLKTLAEIGLLLHYVIMLLINILLNIFGVGLLYCIIWLTGLKLLSLTTKFVLSRRFPSTFSTYESLGSTATNISSSWIDLGIWVLQFLCELLFPMVLILDITCEY